MKWLTDDFLPVGDGHEICVRSTGNPKGVPVVYLHGGPGSGVQEAQLRLFDPKTFHLIAFDQRGAGLSRPKGGRESNTTDHLVTDMEKIRTHFGLERWMIVGGSWGATLALAYAVAHPERVTGIVLRAVFLGTRAELDRAFLAHLPTFYPSLFEDFLGLLTADERAAPLESYWARILSDDSEMHLPAARAWGETERSLSVLSPSNPCLDLSALARPGAPVPSSPFMEAHYFSHDCFLRVPLMERAARLSGIPGRIVQGRYDLLCPPANAHALAEAWPDASVDVVDAAGHDLGHPPIWKAVEAAVSELGKQIAKARA
ncbi:prolyl aminopeptidase [Maritimibacter sp. UBA3975]|uniref:prolyl aminopeptidase n=1 Tax=Maritimibacter sp. UBA3975 TaxID=1946833 RepID=UPI000C0B3EA4|nr:prolyl aminopeptidase [Maritimibacter sp. UBA3975]MAM61571.1 prolyl aminopeptidase [Maritimibacter sp.]|tara:strand:- start:9363 stop:10310 length:948 start_codon:yes stop_codon:yes gene_type:complete